MWTTALDPVRAVDNSKWALAHFFRFPEVIVMTGRRKSQQAAVSDRRSSLTEYELVLREARLELSRPGRSTSARSSAPKLRFPQTVAALRQREA